MAGRIARTFFFEELDVEIQPGWWFQTFLFSISYISDVILPIDELHHFSADVFSSTNQQRFFRNMEQPMDMIIPLRLRRLRSKKSGPSISWRKF
jgi:hypothetical protein